MKSNFFVISNYNSDPLHLINFCEDYLILDQSTEDVIVDLLRQQKDSKIRFVNHVGHNLIDYLDFIIQNYLSMPDRVAFIKGNIIGRHVDSDFWEKSYNNTFYTLLYNEVRVLSMNQNGFSPSPGGGGGFLEVNNSWYYNKSVHRYFTDFNQLLDFLYHKPQYPKWLHFSPGACYIVEKERIIRHPKSLYVGLKEILSYEFFPSEAWMVERLMNIIFTSSWELQPYVFNELEFLERIAALPDRSTEKTKKTRFAKIPRIFFRR